LLDCNEGSLRIKKKRFPTGVGCTEGGFWVKIVKKEKIGVCSSLDGGLKGLKKETMFNSLLAGEKRKVKNWPGRKEKGIRSFCTEEDWKGPTLEGR